MDATTGLFLRGRPREAHLERTLLDTRGTRRRGEGADLTALHGLASAAAAGSPVGASNLRLWPCSSSTVPYGVVLV